MTLSFLHQEGKSALLRAAETGNISAVKRELSGHIPRMRLKSDWSPITHLFFYFAEW